MVQTDSWAYISFSHLRIDTDKGDPLYQLPSMPPGLQTGKLEQGLSLPNRGRSNDRWQRANKGWTLNISRSSQDEIEILEVAPIGGRVPSRGVTGGSKAASRRNRWIEADGAAALCHGLHFGLFVRNEVDLQSWGWFSTAAVRRRNCA